MKKIYLSIILAGVTSFSIGQVTLTAADFNASIGESFDYNQTDYVSPGAAGAGQTWDLSSASTALSSNIDHNAANAAFPATNITQTDIGGGGEFYYDFSSAGQYIHGVSASGTVITYSNSMTYFEYPLSIGTSGSDTHAATFTSGGFPFTRAGSTTWETDGWGTVITPQGTFTDVVRVKITQDYSDDYAGGTIDYVVEIYMWLKSGIHYPVASMSSISYDTGGGPITSDYGTYATGNVGINELSSASFVAYPNPTSNLITVESSSEIESVIVTDLTGKQVATSMESTFDISNLKSGIYLVSILTTEGISSVSQRIMKK